MTKFIYTIVTVFAVSVLGLAGAAHASQELIIEVESPLEFQPTIDRIKSDARDLGWKVPKSWKKNFQKNLKHVTKEDVGKNLVFSMCEPWEAVKLLKHDKYKRFFSMMPCSFAVYEKSDGKVYASFMNIQLMGQMYPDEQPIQDLVNKLGPQMQKMVEFN